MISVSAISIAGIEPVHGQQALSAGCSAVQGGAFNNAPPTPDSQTEQATLEFDAGDTITVFIQDATNAIAKVGAQIIFNGATGTQSGGIVVSQSGSAQVTSTIQGVPGPTSVPFIVWTCEARTPPPGNDRDDNQDDNDNEQNTGDEKPVKPNNAVQIAQVSAAETAAEIANKNIRMPTQAAGLPSMLVARPNARNANEALLNIGIGWRRSGPAYLNGVAWAEVALQIEVVMDGGMNGGEDL